MGFREWFFGLPTQPRLSEDEHRVLKRLEERMLTVEREASQRELEWTMWYDKFRTLFARISKRSERLDQAEQNAAKPAQDALGPTNDGLPMPRQWQLAELARRGANGQ